jgi:hypothetical protein
MEPQATRFGAANEPLRGRTAERTPKRTMSEAATGSPSSTPVERSLFLGLPSRNASGGPSPYHGVDGAGKLPGLRTRARSEVRRAQRDAWRAQSRRGEDSRGAVLLIRPRLVAVLRRHRVDNDGADAARPRGEERTCCTPISNPEVRATMARRPNDFGFDLREPR